jgi:carbonic anhydrase
MKKQLAVTIVGGVILLAGSALASSGGHWTYSGHRGPENWGTLSPDYEICGKGKNQSPIDITGSTEAEMEPIVFSYKTSGLDVVNNGHTIKAGYDAGSEIMVDGLRYNLLQVHWHTPSENNIEGKSFPMEAHFVHGDADGNLAVVGVMYSEGSKNEAIAAVWDHMPAEEGAISKDAKVMVNAMDMLPANKDYYRFNGSLTTPPCTEGVRWMVMKDAVEVSAEQVEAFHSKFHGDTNRPVQAINARPVLK